MKEQDRQRAIRQKLVRTEQQRLPLAGPIPTGFPAIESALGVEGLPRGAIVEIFGSASTGKSTLALQIAGHAICSGLAAAWIDAEHVFDPAQADRLGISIDRFPVVRPDFAEQALVMALRLIESRALDLLVIDSAAALVPRLELETGIGESGPGLQSRVLASGLRKVAAAAHRAGTAIIVLNQTRAGAVPDGEVSSGGPPLKLYAAIRIALEPAQANRVRFRILKNKAGAPFREGVLEWESGWKFTKSP